MKIYRQFAFFFLFLTCGLLVFVVFSPYHPLFHEGTDKIGRILLMAGFLTAALYARSNDRLQKYWLVPLAFFCALTAISVDYYLGLSRWLVPALGLTIKSPPGLAIDKLESSLLGIVIVLVLNRFSGQSLGSLYIRRGNLRLGLIVGLVAWVVMVASLIPITEMFFKGKDLSWARILPWVPWVIIMVFSNAAYEELILRGLLIGRMESFLGKFSVNLATTIPFILLHAFTSYSTNAIIFLALQLLPLSLVWCWLMQKTKSIWGSVLFHAAMDIPVFVGIFSQL